jgi:hypothetical protein
VRAAIWEYLLIAGAVILASSPVVTGAGIDTVVDWSYDWLRAPGSAASWPDPATHSLGLGILAADGTRNVELLVFPIFGGRIGGPEFVQVRSRFAIAISGDPRSFGGWGEVYIAPSALFYGQREALFSLDLGFEGPKNGSLTLSTRVGPHLQLAMSPSFAVTEVYLAMSVGAEMRVPLTYAAEWEEGFLEGALIAPLALAALSMIGLGYMGLLMFFLHVRT